MSNIQNREKARNAVFQRLEQIVDIAALSKEDREKYDEAIKQYRDKLVVDEFNIQKGREQGKLENQLEVARSLKQDGLPLDFIAKHTHLPLDTITKL